MARSRSRRRKSSFRGALVAAGGVAILAAGAYFLWPGTPREAAGTAPAPSSPPAGPPRLSAEIESPPNPTTRSAEPTGEKPPARAEPEGAAAGDSAVAGGDGPADPPDPTTRAIAPVIAAAAVSELISRSISLEDSGNPYEARTLLNDALQSGRLEDDSADALKARIRELNQTIIFTPGRRFPQDPQQTAYTVQPGDVLVKICRDVDVPANFIARVNAVKPTNIRPGQSLKIIKGPVHAVVSKRRFTMDLYLGALPGEPGSMYLTTYRVGLGEDGSTPTGLWEVTPGSKAVNPAWTNPRTNESFEPDDAKNPLGERWIGLTGVAGAAVGAVSYGIHGTIEPESIGKNASMGCIRLKHEDVIQLFDMLSEGRSTVLVVN